MDLARGVERYLRHHRAEGSSPKTLEWHTYSLTQFAQYLKSNGHDDDVEALAADDLREYIDYLRGRGLAQSSVATKVRSIKAWAKWLLAEEYVGRDPFARVKQTKQEDKAKETFTPDEIDRLLVSCDRKRLTGARD